MKKAAENSPKQQDREPKSSRNAAKYNKKQQKSMKKAAGGRFSFVFCTQKGHNDPETLGSGCSLVLWVLSGALGCSRVWCSLGALSGSPVLSGCSPLCRAPCVGANFASEASWPQNKSIIVSIGKAPKKAPQDRSLGLSGALVALGAFWVSPVLSGCSLLCRAPCVGALRERSELRHHYPQNNDSIDKIHIFTAIQAIALPVL